MTTCNIEKKTYSIIQLRGHEPMIHRGRFSLASLEGHDWNATRRSLTLKIHQSINIHEKKDADAQSISYSRYRSRFSGGTGRSP